MKTIQEFFANAVSSNPELRAKINAAQSPAEIVKLATAAGYAFTEEALSSVIDTLTGKSEELSDAELETVAGGMMCTYSAYTKQATSGNTKCCYG